MSQVDYHEHTTEEYINFLKQPFASNFGITEEEMAKFFMNYENSYLQAAIAAWGMTKANLKSEVMPALTARLGGYVVFLMITIVEGASMSNYINHWGGNTSATMLGQAADDMSYVAGGTVINDPTGQHVYPGVLTTNYPVNTSAPEVDWTIHWDSGIDIQAIYDSMPDNSIGKYYMVATMAGNAWAFGNDYTSTQYAYFGNPYDNLIDFITALGGDPYNGGTPAKKTSGKTATAKDKTDPPKPKEAVEKAEPAKVISATNFFKKVQDALKNNVYDSDREERWFNSIIQVVKMFNNTLRVKLKDDYFKNILDTLTADDVGGTTNKKTSAGTSKHVSIATHKKEAPTTDINAEMLKYAKAHLGDRLDFDGKNGAQCVDLITSMNAALHLGLDLSGLSAYEIWEAHHSNPPSGWTYKTITDDGPDWDALPNGAIVWFADAGYTAPGHVAIKSSATRFDVYNQNYNIPYPEAVVRGGPDVQANLNWNLNIGQNLIFVGGWYHN